MKFALKLLKLFFLCLLVLLIGLVIGAMIVLLPPTAPIAAVGVVGLVLIWSLRELERVPEIALRRALFFLIIIDLCVPAYYAVQIPSLPWISIRRIITFVAIMLFSITIAGSPSIRRKVGVLLRTGLGITICSFGFFTMAFLSVFTSENIATSMSQFLEISLNWYVPFIILLMVVDSEDDVHVVMKIICTCCVIISAAGLIEFLIERRFFLEVFPKSILDKMMFDNPSIAAMVNSSPYRNGLYRASSVFTVPLSFGEFEAMAAPIAGYYMLHGKSRGELLLGAAAFVCVLAGLFCSGSRGGYLAFLISTPALMLLWIIRYSRTVPSGLGAAIVSVLTFAFALTTLILVLFWPRLHNIVLGGGDAVSSGDARLIQWQLAEPHIIQNPITGHGLGLGAEVVGYYTASPIPSLDTYIITLLVETGVPGFLFFSGMIFLAVWFLARLYLTDLDPRAAIAGPIACAFLAFGVNRTVLSQRENQTLFYLLVALTLVLLRLAAERSAQVANGSIKRTRLASRWNEPVRTPVGAVVD